MGSVGFLVSRWLDNDDFPMAKRDTLTSLWNKIQQLEGYIKQSDKAKGRCVDECLRLTRINSLLRDVVIEEANMTHPQIDALLREKGFEQ